VADSDVSSQGGIHFHNGTIDVSMSDSSIGAIAQIWFGTLDRLINHPMYGAAAFVLALVALGMWFRLHSQRQMQEHEYKLYRANAQTQMMLPFANGEQRPRGQSAVSQLGRPKQEERQ
jgi:hypothetical protein